MKNPERIKRPFQVMVKPIGPKCNLACDYCFYLSKEKLFVTGNDFRLTDSILEQFIKSYIQSQIGPEIAFVWQGGEPTLMGLDFFYRVRELQEKYRPQGITITNALQTNATLITPAWARFLKKENFLVGVSIDGLQADHDLFRKDKNGLGTWARVVAGLSELLQQDVETNLLVVVNAQNGSTPLATYTALQELGAKYLQFIPLVEHKNGKLSSRSISGEGYGRFLVSIFNHWVEHDLGEVFVQIFEEALRMLAGFPSSMCLFSPQCGGQLVMEHNGDIYACDHFVEPNSRLGNIIQDDLRTLVDSQQQRVFGAEKANLAAACFTCPVLQLCQGECPKNRVQGLNLICQGYRRFFLYTQTFFADMLQVLQQGKPALAASDTLRARLQNVRSTKRNELCPCGSTLKFKKCCESYF